MQEDVICDSFDIIDDYLLYVVIDCEGERFSKTFEDDSIVELIDVMVVLSKYREKNAFILIETIYLAGDVGDGIVGCLDYMWE